MRARKIRPGVTWMGAQDFDRRLFDELIPLPEGTSYNAYLVEGSEKVALIDTVDPDKIATLLAQLEGVPRLDYLIVQHVEQDHSGSVPRVLEKYPEATVVTTPKGKGMILDHLHVAEERIKTVEDGETLSLGDRTCRFIHAPWVHWPETMLTLLEEEKVLFTCDLFGSHVATTELYAHDKQRIYEAAKRYYAEIMMPFRTVIKGHLEKLAGLEFELIAPSHGPVYDDVNFILDAYRHWILDPPEDLVIVPYVSMHGSTQVAVQRLVDNLVDHGVRTEPFNLTVTDVGRLAISLVDASTAVFATPTVLTGPHPSIVSAAYLTNALRPKLRYAGAIASYGWAGKAERQLADLLPSLKVDWLEPVVVKGLANDEDLRSIDRLAEAIAERHRTEDKNG